MAGILPVYESVGAREGCLPWLWDRDGCSNDAKWPVFVLEGYIWRFTVMMRALGSGLDMLIGV